MESLEHHIAKEEVKSRPEVFSRESFPAVIRFAGRFNRLLLSDAAKASTEQEVFDNIGSLAELKALVDKHTAILVRRELGEVLRDAKTQEGHRATKSTRSLYKEKDFKSLLNAAADKQFDGVDESRKTFAATALGVSLVAERARTANMDSALNALPESALERFGMTALQREIVSLFLNAITKINAEYIRVQLRMRGGEHFPERPVDALRERRFIAEAFFGIQEAIKRMRNEGGEAVFGSHDKDSAFLDYINVLQESYRAFEEGGSTPLSFEEQQDRIARVQRAFLSLHTAHPDFPPIVFPAFSHYGGDEAAEKSGKSWQGFGFDPEIRLYWQTKEQREKQKQYHTFRDRFAAKIQASYPGLVDTAPVRQYRVLIGELIAASGINIKEMTTSQEEQNIILITESKPDAVDHEAGRIFETYLVSEEDIALVRCPAFRGLENKRAALHEFGHGLYPEASPEAEALGEYDDQLCELKSDLAMWVTAGSVLREDAKKNFGERDLRAVQLSLIADAIGMYRGIGRADRAYVVAAQRVLGVLRRENVLIEREGKIVIDTIRLDQDLGPAFEKELSEVLTVYKGARGADESSGVEAFAKAKKIVGLKPEKFFEAVRVQA